MTKKQEDYLKGIEEALFIIALTLIWKPLGVFFFVALILKAHYDQP
jgi:hypothetical protein